MDKVIPFPCAPKPEIKPPLSIMDVEQIGFLSITDRNLWVKNPKDIIRIMKFIIQEKIPIIEEE